jgi:hypothetical protein
MVNGSERVKTEGRGKTAALRPAMNGGEWLSGGEGGILRQPPKTLRFLRVS